MKALVIFTADNPEKIKELYCAETYYYKNFVVAWRNFNTLSDARIFLAENIQYSVEFYRDNWKLILGGEKDDFTYNGVTIGIKINDDRSNWLEYAKRFL